MIHYTCDRCGLRRDMDYVPRVYALSQDRYVRMEQRHIWCSGCADISVCESLVRMEEHLEQIQTTLQKYRALRDNPPADLSVLKRHERFQVERAAESVREMEQHEREWEEWRALRSAPVRCLKCNGPVEHVPVSDWEALPHPGCGGTLQIAVSISSANGPADEPHVYSVDGVLLARGRKATLTNGALNPVNIPMDLFYGESRAKELT